MKKILNYLFEHRTLNRSEAEEVLTKIAGNSYTESEIAAFITVYLMRSITVDELEGFRDAMLNLCLKTDLSEFDTIDVCGTGGDGKDTFNISTLTTFVLAGAGIKVTKHGNYAVTSSCGSSNIMEHFGYKFSNSADKLRNELDKAGVCFLHAPLFNPAMKNIAPVRRALRVKTFFNMLGPMINPAMPKKQLIGVYSLELARLYNYLYQKSSNSFSIVHSLDGYDEVSLTSDFKYYKNGIEKLAGPEDFGFSKVTPDELAGGKDVVESANIFMSVLDGNGTEAQNNVVIANAILAIECFYPQLSIAECREMAFKSLTSKRAKESFAQLIAMQ